MSASGRGALTRKTNIGVPIVGSSKVAESHFGGRWVSSCYGRGYPFEGILLIQPYLVSAAMGDGSLKGLVDKSADLFCTAQKISVPSRPYEWLRLVGCVGSGQFWFFQRVLWLCCVGFGWNWSIQIRFGGRSGGLMAMFCRSARMPYPPMYKLPLIQAQIKSGIYLSSVRYTLAIARIVVSKCSGLLLASALLSKRDMLGGSRHWYVAGSEICRRCSSPKGEMLKSGGAGEGCSGFLGLAITVIRFGFCYCPQAVHGGKWTCRLNDRRAEI